VPKCEERRRSQGLWQLCVSALLIGLVLYNPFFVLANQTSGLAYQALACHRATVGASEMQHFAPVQTEDAQLEATVAEILGRLMVEESEFSAHELHKETLPQRPELLASIWFRPPPTR
jgi:hypothetical protein